MVNLPKAEPVPVINAIEAAINTLVVLFLLAVVFIAVVTT